MRVTSKGQVTIPKEVREKLGIEPGDEVGFREEGQAMIVEKAKPAEPINPGAALARHLAGKGPAMRQGRPMMTSEELIELTRGRRMNVDDTA